MELAYSVEDVQYVWVNVVADSVSVLVILQISIVKILITVIVNV
jgi:hypothetical protein